MNMVGLILVMAMAVYTLRIVGFLLADVAMPSAWEQALSFVPVATLTALVAACLSGSPDNRPIRLVAAVSAGVAARYTGRAWVCIVVGMSVYGLLSLLIDYTGSW